MFNTTKVQRRQITKKKKKIGEPIPARCWSSQPKTRRTPPVTASRLAATTGVLGWWDAGKSRVFAKQVIGKVYPSTPCRWRLARLGDRRLLGDRQPEMDQCEQPKADLVRLVCGRAFWQNWRRVGAEARASTVREIEACLSFIPSLFWGAWRPALGAAYAGRSSATCELGSWGRGGVVMSGSGPGWRSGATRPGAERRVSGGRKGARAIQASAPALATRSDVADAAWSGPRNLSP